MKEVLNKAILDAKPSRSPVGHWDQTVDMPTRAKNSQQVIQGTASLVGITFRTTNKKNISKISGSRFMKDQKNGVMPVESNIKSLNVPG